MTIIYWTKNDVRLNQVWKHKTTGHTIRIYQFDDNEVNWDSYNGFDDIQYGMSVDIQTLLKEYDLVASDVSDALWKKGKYE